MTERNISSGTSAPRAILGLALLAPAALCCAFGLLVPTMRTFVTSFQNANPLRAAEWVGMTNYGAMFQDQIFSRALGFTLSIVMVRLLIVAVAPLLLALAAHRLGRVARALVRLMFSVPLALFAPVSIALVWSMALNPQFGLFGRAPWLAEPARARLALLLIDSLYTFGLACGLGLIFYLAALRGSAGHRRAVIVTWVAGVLATIALTLQSFTLSFVLTGGGPANSTATLALYQYTQAFQFFRFGPAAAAATLVLILAGLLGLIAGLLVVFFSLRIEMMPPRTPAGSAGGGRALALVLLLLLLLVGVGVGALGLTPLIWNALNSLKSNAEVLASPALFFPSEPSLDAYRRLDQALPFQRARLNSIGPPLVAIFLIQLPLAYLGALGIGALRPLGRRSEWLLLPFSPWLFVTIGPLSVSAFMGMQAAGQLNSPIALLPPILISVPALFILTLFFKGQEPRWRAACAEGQAMAGAFVRTLILPSLPLAGLLASALLLASARGLLWPLLTINSADQYPVNVALVVLRGAYQSDWPLMAAAVTSFELPLFVCFFLIFGALHVLYLERLALAAGPAPVEAARDYATRRLDV